MKSAITIDRRHHLAKEYFSFIDSHVTDLILERSTKMMELSAIAKELCCTQKYLIEIINELHGHHPCHFYVQKILDVSRGFLLMHPELPVSEIARRLTYDPSNFNKFFKKYTGQTPGQFRAERK